MVTREVWDTLATSSNVFLRTRVHPVVEHLPANATYHSFDYFYEQSADFAAVYASIVAEILNMAEAGQDVVYAVPGDPLVGEGTVTQLLDAARTRGISTKILHGVSFIEPSLALLQIDGVDGLQLLDAIDIARVHHPPINPDQGALIAQVYSRALASDVKLTLMNQYPDEHSVKLIHAAGTAEQRIEPLLLYQIDQVEVSHLTSLYVPPLVEDGLSSFEGFQDTIAHLRAPEGCPWDREQTHESLRSYLLEEVYEVLEAIDAEDTDALREELGDLLLQIVLHCQIAIEEGEFSAGDMIQTIDAKIKRRHPHVWGDVDVNGDAAKVESNWETIKAEERSANGDTRTGILDGVAKALPALAQAHEYDRRAARVGFDWPDQAGVIAKVREEIEEVLVATSDSNRVEEIGDLLLAVAVWARWFKINPEDALRLANQRFYERFSYIERVVEKNSWRWEDMKAEELDRLWREAKLNLASE
jgi:tetrapyrrole methylase family protein/MazG family protein